MEKKTNFKMFSKYFVFALSGHYKPGVSRGCSTSYAGGDFVLRYEDLRKKNPLFL